MTKASGGKGAAHDVDAEVTDDAGSGTEVEALRTRLAEAEAAHEGAVAKVEKQRAHLQAAEDSVAALEVAVDEARAALAQAEGKA